MVVHCIVLFAVDKLVAVVLVLVGRVDGHVAARYVLRAAVVAGAVAVVHPVECRLVAAAVAQALCIEPRLAFESKFATTLFEQFGIRHRRRLGKSCTLAHHVEVLHGGGVGCSVGGAHHGFHVGQVYIGKTHQVDVVGGILHGTAEAAGIGVLAHDVFLDMGIHLVAVLDRGVLPVHAVDDFISVASVGLAEAGIEVAVFHESPLAAQVVAFVALLQRYGGAFASSPLLVGEKVRAAPRRGAAVAVAVSERSALYRKDAFRTVVLVHVEQRGKVDACECFGVLYAVQGVGGGFFVERLTVVAVVFVGSHGHTQLGTQRAGFAHIKTPCVGV